MSKFWAFLGVVIAIAGLDFIGLHVYQAFGPVKLSGIVPSITALNFNSPLEKAVMPRRLSVASAGQYRFEFPPPTYRTVAEAKENRENATLGVVTDDTLEVVTEEHKVREVRIRLFTFCPPNIEGVNHDHRDSCLQVVHVEDPYGVTSYEQRLGWYALLKKEARPQAWAMLQSQINSEHPQRLAVENQGGAYTVILPMRHAEMSGWYLKAFSLILRPMELRPYLVESRQLASR